MKMMNSLGKVQKTQQGFERIEFVDRYGDECSLQADSFQAFACLPGTSAVWLQAGTLSPRIHLDRKQVKALIAHLTNWLERGTFEVEV